MNINKVIKLEIKEFKKLSDSLTLSVAEEFQLDIEKRIDEYLIPIETRMNDIYLKSEITEDDLYEVYTMIEEFKDILENFKSFCDSSIKKVGLNSRPKYDENINLFVSNLLKRGVFDRNRIAIEMKKVSYYQITRVTEGLNIAINSLFDIAYKRLSLNAEFFNNLLDIIEEINENSDIDDVDVIKEEKVKREKITNVKDMIKLVESRGFKSQRKTGSHIIFKNESGDTTVVPYHSSGFNKGLGFEIQKQIGM